MTHKKSAREKPKPRLIDSDVGLTYKIQERYPFTDNQKKFIELAQGVDTKIVLCDGPAGTAKTFLSVYVALHALKLKKYEHITYVRSIVESAARKLGSLPGEVDDKFRPWIIPLIEKCDELIGPSAASSLIENGYIHCVPVNYLRGSTFRDSVVIVDEAQNLEMSELITVLTRYGHNTKMFIIGDSFQSDIQKLCFQKVAEVFKGDDSLARGIVNFHFTEQDIVRDELLKFIVGKIATLNEKHPHRTAY